MTSTWYVSIPTCHAAEIKLKSHSVAGGDRAFVISGIKTDQFFTNAALIPAGR